MKTNLAPETQSQREEVAKDDVESEVVELISSEFGVPRDAVLPQKKLMDDLGLDSIDLCDALVQLESRTGRPFPLERFRGVVTISDFVEVASAILRTEQK